MRDSKLVLAEAKNLLDISKKILTKKKTDLLDKNSKYRLHIGLGHDEDVTSVVVSPDGRYVVSGSIDNTIKLWDINSGVEIQTFDGCNYGITSVAISPDGKYIVSGGWGNIIKLWDISSGKEIQTFDENSNSIFMDSTGIFGSDYSADKYTLQYIREASWEYREDVVTVAFSQDERYIIAGSDYNDLHDSKAGNTSVTVWEISSGKKIRRFNGNHTVAIGSDGRRIVLGSDDETIKLWEVNSGEEIQTFYGLDGVIWSTAISPDGKYMVSVSSNIIKLWDINSGEEIRTFYGHDKGIRSIAISPDSKYIISGSDDKTIKLWDINNGKEIRTFYGHDYILGLVAISPNGKYIFHEDVCSTYYDPHDPNNTDFIWPVAISLDGRYIVSGGFEIMELWNKNSRKRIRTFDYCGQATSIAISSDSKYVVSGVVSGKGYHEIILWELSSGKNIRTFDARYNGVISIAISPDCNYIVSGGRNNSITLWDIESEKEIQTFFEDFYDEDRIEIADDVLTFLQYGIAYGDDATSVVFSPNGKYIISGSSSSDERDIDHIFNRITMWEVSSGKNIRTFKGHSDHINSVAISPNGKYIVSGSKDKTVKLWDINSGEEIRTFYGHDYSVEIVAFSPNGKYIIAGSHGENIWLWEVSSGKELMQHISFENGEWISYTTDGYYSCSDGASKYISFLDESGSVSKVVDKLDPIYKERKKDKLLDIDITF